LSAPAGKMASDDYYFFMILDMWPATAKQKICIDVLKNEVDLTFATVTWYEVIW